MQSFDMPLQKNVEPIKPGLKSEPDVVSPADEEAAEIMSEMQTLNVLPESKEGPR